MNDATLTHEFLLLEVLNAICAKTKIKPSALILLNFHFTDAQLQALDTYLFDHAFGQQALSTQDVAQKLHEIRPNMTAADYFFIAQDLVAAWKHEERYHGLNFI